MLKTNFIYLYFVFWFDFIDLILSVLFILFEFLSVLFILFDMVLFKKEVLKRGIKVSREEVKHFIGREINKREVCEGVSHKLFLEKKE